VKSTGKWDFEKRRNRKEETIETDFKEINYDC
jgi:hypothetical protein